MSRHHVELVHWLEQRAVTLSALARTIPQGMTAGEIVNRIEEAELAVEQFEGERDLMLLHRT